MNETVNLKKNYINYEKFTEPKTGVLFVDFINSVIERRKQRISLAYGNVYKSLVFQLNQFSKDNNVDIFTNSITAEFLDDFIIYLEGKDLRASYIKGLVDLSKSMVRRAENYGYITDISYDDVNLKSDEPFAVALSMNEITRIYYFQGLTRKQERIRDLFIVGCLTALRYSDYSTLNKNNFQEDFIVKTTKKTKKKVTIPIHEYVKEIYNKYDGDISKSVSVQHFNRYIKEICRRVGLNSKVTFDYTKGGKLITEVKEKWELISSHTARRSAATNMKLTGRMTIDEIMSFTGHTTEKSLRRYLKITDRDNISNIANDNYFRI